MAIYFKNKRELTFLGIGVLMIFIVILYTVLAIRFLVSNLNQVFNKKITEPTAESRFQIEKAEILQKR